jgi:hypothetical protein
MNVDNQLPASARGLYYGVSDVPYLFIDGGGYDGVLKHERSYDFTTQSPDSLDILNRALMAPDFNIELEINELSPKIQMTVIIEALKDIPKKELTLHTVVMEVLIDDPLYIGSNGVTKFENVARMMLPDVGGKNFNKAWSEGDTTQLTIDWTEPFDYLTEDNIAIVVFLQDYNTREVLQAAGYSTEDRPTSSHGIIGFDGPLINIYPNPAQEYINVDLRAAYADPVLIRLYNISGKRVMEEQVPPLQTEVTLNLQSLKYGLYIIEIRNKTGLNVIHHGKVIVN